MKIDYLFPIDHEIIVEMMEIIKQNRFPKQYVEEMEKLEEDSKWRPYRDFHWEVSRLISMYFSPEMIKIDPNFGKLNEFLMHRWRETLPESMRQEMFSRNFKTK